MATCRHEFLPSQSKADAWHPITEEQTSQCFKSLSLIGSTPRRLAECLSAFLLPANIQNLAIYSRQESLAS